MANSKLIIEEVRGIQVLAQNFCYKNLGGTGRNTQVKRLTNLRSVLRLRLVPSSTWCGHECKELLEFWRTINLHSQPENFLVSWRIYITAYYIYDGLIRSRLERVERTRPASTADCSHIYFHIPLVAFLALMKSPLMFARYPVIQFYVSNPRIQGARAKFFQ